MGRWFGYLGVGLVATCMLACSGIQRPLSVPTTPLATEPVPQPAANALPTGIVSVSTARFTYQGITFSYANGLIRSLTTNRLPASRNVTVLSADQQPAYYLGVPDFLVFNFDGTTEPLASSRLVVQPLRDRGGLFYAGYPESEIGRFEELAVQIEAAEDTTMDTLRRRLPFQNGSGLRTIGYLPGPAELAPLSDDQIFYLFEGLTRDGRYHIWLQFNVQTPILPDAPGQFGNDEREAFAAGTADYQAYLQEQRALVAALPPTAFTPDLTSLDALVASLHVPSNATVDSSLPINEEGCKHAAASADVTIPDGTEVEPGQSFVKIWEIENKGTCIWSAAYQFVSEGTTLLRETEPVMTLLRPGETTEISLTYTAPVKLGLHQETWQIRPPSSPELSASETITNTKLTVIVEVVGEEP